MARAKRVIKNRTVAWIAALTAVLLSAPPMGRAEEPASQQPAPQVTENPARTSAEIQPGDKLTVDKCVQIAIWNSPNIVGASRTVSAKRSRIGQAWSDYYPKIELGGSYLKSNTQLSNPMNAYQAPFRQDSYAWSAKLTQNIVDFGRTDAQVSIKQKELDASQEDFRDAESKVVFNVKSAYYELLQREKSCDVLRENVALVEKQLEKARGFYEAGEKPKFDVTSAEVDLYEARVKLIQEENALRIARVTLNNAMGVPDAPEYSIEDTLSFQKYAITFEEARERAFLNRPDIRSSVAQRKGAEESLALARKGHLPLISGNVSYTKAGETYSTSQDRWDAAVVLMVPFFSGFKTTHEVREAGENLAVSRANEDAKRQDVLLDVQKAYLKLLEAEETIGWDELAVKKAEENYALAHGQYEEGVGSALDEALALVKLSNARLNVVAALAKYKLAEAELQKAMGE